MPGQDSSMSYGVPKLRKCPRCGASLRTWAVYDAVGWITHSCRRCRWYEFKPRPQPNTAAYDGPRD